MKQKPYITHNEASIEMLREDPQFEMAKTAPQSLFQSQTREELLDEDEPRERGQLTVLKTKLRKAFHIFLIIGSAFLLDL